MARRREAPRVCLFTSVHKASDGRVVDREAASLADAGYDVTYYTPFDDATVDGVDVVSYASPDDDDAVPGIRDRLRWSAAVARRLLATDFDVYHFHDAELLPVGAMLAARSSAPVIYDVHENVADVLAHKDVFPRPLEPFLVPAAARSELLLSRRVDAVVAASPDVAARFDGHGDVTTVANYPRRRWAEGTDLGGDDGRNADGETRFVYRGLLSADRGVTTMLDAIERVPDEHDVSLAIGGKYASGAVRAQVERRADASDRVELVPWLAGLAEVIELFRDCEVGLHCFRPDPNKAAAMHRSNKLFQYMATGLPVVVSDFGEWPRFVEDVGCGVPVDPEDPDAIAGTMVALHEDAARRRELGRNGHRAVLERFNWATQRRNLLDLYGRLVGGPPAGNRQSAGVDGRLVR